VWPLWALPAAPCKLYCSRPWATAAVVEQSTRHVRLHHLRAMRSKSPTVVRSLHGDQHKVPRRHDVQTGHERPRPSSMPPRMMVLLLDAPAHIMPMEPFVMLRKHSANHGRTTLTSSGRAGRCFRLPFRCWRWRPASASSRLLRGYGQAASRDRRSLQSRRLSFDRKACSFARAARTTTCAQGLLAPLTSLPIIVARRVVSVSFSSELPACILKLEPSTPLLVRGFDQGHEKKGSALASTIARH
jgi:hypothetical protein